MTAAEPGWYHAEGDPPGTIRLWNGTDWVGFPQRDPGTPVSAMGESPEEASAAIAPAPGQRHLGIWSIFAIGGLALPLIAYLFQAYVFVRIIGLMERYQGQSLDAIMALPEPPPDIVDVAVLQGISLIAIIVGTMLAGIAFVAWFYVAYANCGRWEKTRFASWWAILGWLVPIINFKRPNHIMQELCEKSPPPGYTGAINPVIAWAWWIGLIVCQVSLRLLGQWAARVNNFETLQSVMLALIVLCLTSAVCAGLAIKLVRDITLFQDLRFRLARRASNAAPALAA
ncbi:MAG: DUF4328 domain-containing protein [Actinomycetota bacterium]